ncbi:hypothetical protein LguiB_028767 [Lonicera macranthoides]
MLNVAPVVVPSTENGHAARMFLPGPIMSGFRMPGLAWFGPLEENEVTSGAPLTPNIVPLNEIVACGNGVVFI